MDLNRRCIIQALMRAFLVVELEVPLQALFQVLFVVYQKVILGLNYGKIHHELTTYFGLRVSKGQLSNIVAEVAALFGLAYQRLIAVLRQQAAVHVDEAGWRVNGNNHWLWVFISDVVTLYTTLSVSRRRYSLLCHPRRCKPRRTRAVGGCSLPYCRVDRRYRARPLVWRDPVPCSACAGRARGC